MLQYAVMSTYGPATQMPWGVMHSQRPSSILVSARPGMPNVEAEEMRARLGNFSMAFSNAFSYRNPVLVLSLEVSMGDLLFQK